MIAAKTRITFSVSITANH